MASQPSGAAPTPQLPPVPRRNFLQWLVGSFGVVWGLIALYPIYRYLRAPASLTAVSNVSSVMVGMAQDLPVGNGKNFQFGSIPGIVTHTPDGFHAFNAICTHLGCTVQFRKDMGKIWCACHGGTYDPATGAVLAGPPPKPLAPLEVAVKAGKIVVSQS